MKNYSKKEQEKRKEALLPNNKPRYVRCYDNGAKGLDRYTIVFTGRYKGDLSYIKINEEPSRFLHYGTSRTLIDDPSYGHLGKSISFNQLPEKCKEIVINHYLILWEFKEEMVMV